MAKAAATGPKGGGKRKFIDVDRGLFLVRYAAADDEQRPPSVRVVPADSNGSAAVVLHPDATDSLLGRPGTALVVKAEAPARLAVEVMPSVRNGSTAATVQIEALSTGVPAVPRAASGAGQGMRLLAHVAGIGDVVVGAGEWVGGPSAPSRIEGFALDWADKPAGVSLRYAVRSGRAQGPIGQAVAAGTFAGSRGKALPITGVVLEVAGDPDALLSAEALFFGAPPIKVTGRRIVLNGPTAREPLVGLKLSTPARKHEPAPVRAEPPAKQRAGKVRVFKGQAKANHAAAPA